MQRSYEQLNGKLVFPFMSRSSFEMSDKKVAVSSSKTAKPGGPYSPGVIVQPGGRLLYLAGQIGKDPQTNRLVYGGIQAETRRALENIGNVLSAAGATFE